MTKLLTDAETREIETLWTREGTQPLVILRVVRKLLADRALLMAVAKVALPFAEWFVDLERTKVRLPDTNERALIAALCEAGLMESEHE